MITIRDRRSAQEIAEAARAYARTPGFAGLIQGSLSNKGESSAEICRKGWESLQQDKTIQRVFLVANE